MKRFIVKYPTGRKKEIEATDLLDAALIILGDEGITVQKHPADILMDSFVKNKLTKEE